jgi:PIN domain nuclease of toxin-antitoxin system
MIWLAADEPVAASATAAMDEAYRRDEAVWVSPISAWEIGILAARGRMALSTSPQAWFRKALAQIGVALCVLEPETLIESSFLPRCAHGSKLRWPARARFCASPRRRSPPSG